MGVRKHLRGSVATAGEGEGEVIKWGQGSNTLQH